MKQWLQQALLAFIAGTMSLAASVVSAAPTSC